jgi:PAP2 superfamily
VKQPAPASARPHLPGEHTPARLSVRTGGAMTTNVAAVTGLRPVTATAAVRRAVLAWPRLPAAAELATIGAGYAAYSLIRLVIRAGHQVAFRHAAELWQAERQLHLTVEPYLNHLAAAHTLLAEAVGYYYGLLHFLVTPLVLAWLYLRRPAAFPRLRSGLVLATAAANVVFWAWPAAPPRFSVPGMTDILVAHDILGAAHPRGAAGLVNLYAAMPSLHVAWATWCAAAVITTTRGRWRHLAWLYPAATTLVVLVSANHFLLDVAGGLAVAGLSMLAASRPSIGLHMTAGRWVGSCARARQLIPATTHREP